MPITCPCNTYTYIKGSFLQVCHMWLRRKMFVSQTQVVNTQVIKFVGRLCPFHILYPRVNQHGPWQIGVGRFVSTKSRSCSGSMLIYKRAYQIQIYLYLYIIQLYIYIYTRVHACALKTKMQSHNAPDYMYHLEN